MTVRNLKPTPWGTPLDVILAVRRVNKALRSRFDRALHGMYISYAQFEVLLLLSTDRNLHAAAVARELKISPQAVQHLIEKLELGGLIDTLPPEGNVIGLRLTHEGGTRLRLATQALGRTHRRIGDLPQDLRTRVVQDLTRIERALTRPLDAGEL
ncbi:MAG TPA: MarR family transcriptional regulator [Actinomycetota bacterium]|nr:MarR family transcriptional regulator [Actinomycetota bacterium]